jgi:hypothetical protein
MTKENPHRIVADAARAVVVDQFLDQQATASPPTLQPHAAAGRPTGRHPGDATEAGRVGLQQFHRLAMQGGGVFEASIVRPEYVLSMALSVQNGHIFRALAQWLAMLRGGGLPLCLTCEYEFTPDSMPTAFCVSKTLNREPMLLVTGVCAQCGSKCDEDLLAAARRLFREMGMVREDAR